MNDGNEPLIRLVGVRKVFYTDEIETHALSDVHLEVHSGQFVEVMGPSGCGKSTLLAIVGLLDTPTEGEYWLEGRPVFKLSGHERARVRNDSIGFIFQAFNLIADMTVFENVELPLLVAGVKPGEARRRAETALASVGLADQANKRPAAMSGGQQQRVFLARALVRLLRGYVPDAVADRLGAAMHEIEEGSGSQVESAEDTASLLAKVEEKAKGLDDYLDLAKSRSQDPETVTEMVGSARGEALRIDAIVRSLLAYARPSHVEPGAFDPWEVVERVEELLTAQGRLDRAEVRWPARDGSVELHGDRTFAEGDTLTIDGARGEVLRQVPLVPPLIELGRRLGWSPLPLTIRDARREIRGLKVDRGSDGDWGIGGFRD